MSTSARASRRRQAGEHAVLRGQHQRAAQRNCGERAREPRADREPGARNVRLEVVAAEREIDDGGLVARQQLGKAGDVDAQLGVAAPDRGPAGAGHPVSSPASASTNTSLPAHLAQPRRGHHRAHLGVVDQHDARAERADILVGRLHQLAAGRGERAGDMAGRVFGGIAHVEQIERARRRRRASARACARSMRATPKRRATSAAADLAQAKPVGATRSAHAAPCRSRRRGRRGSSPWCRCAAPPPCSARRR